MIRLRNIGVSVLVMLFAYATVAQAEPLSMFERTTLVIETEKGRHEFNVELALTQAEQMQGLMFRRRLAADAGMLFYHQRDLEARMWMRNTFLPLDMLFVAADGRIVHIAERTVPKSLTPISAGQPVRAVLEVNAGTVRRLAIKPGDRLIHPLFENADERR